MTSDAHDAAESHWTRVVGAPATAEALAEGTDRLCIQLRAGLGRWIGTEGFASMHERASAMVHEAHPATRHHDFDGGDYQTTISAIRVHGEEAVHEGVIAWVAAVIELLGRVVGRKMAIRLVEQTAAPSPRGIVANEGEERSDVEEE